MATITTKQLQGTGSVGPTLLTNYPYVLTCINPNDSSYLVLQSNKDNNGTYNTSGTTFGFPCASGNWVDNQVGGLVYDKYITGFVVPPGSSSVMYTPDTANGLATRYKFRGTGTFSLDTFTPRTTLFPSTLYKGVWFDASDLTTLFQNAGGTVPVTAVGQPVGKWLDKSGNNAHATQVISSSRPTYQIDPYGYPYLEFDGVNDFMVTSAINFASPVAITSLAATVGILTLNSASAGTAGIVVELGSDVNTVDGSFYITAPSSTADHGFALRGNRTIAARVNNIVTGDDILTGIFQIPQPTKELEITPRLNGQTALSSSITWTGTDAGGGNFGNLPLYIGARSGSQFFFKGHMYQIIVRGIFNVSSTDNYQTEVFTNFKLNGPKDFNPSPLSSSLPPAATNINAFDAGNPISYPGSGSVWTNLSGSFNAILYNGVVYSTNGSGSLVFDGVNDYASIPYDTSFDFSGGNYTINMWVKPNNYNSETTLTSRQWQSTFTDWYFALTDNSNLHAYAEIPVDPYYSDVYFPLSPALNTNTWYLISIVSTASVVSVYINGVIQGTPQTFTPSNTIDSRTLVYMMDTPTFHNPMSGSLATVDYYRTSYSGSQITSYFNNTKARFGY